MPDRDPAPAQHVATPAQIAEMRAVAPGLDTIEGAMVRMLLAAYDAQAARLADIWLLVDLWDQGTEDGLETLERLVALKETGHVES